MFHVSRFWFFFSFFLEPLRKKRNGAPPSENFAKSPRSSYYGRLQGHYRETTAKPQGNQRETASTSRNGDPRTHEILPKSPALQNIRRRQRDLSECAGSPRGIRPTWTEDHAFKDDKTKPESYRGSSSKLRLKTNKNRSPHIFLKEHFDGSRRTKT